MKKKIVIVEDDPGILEALRMIIEKETYDIQTLLNGKLLLKGLPYTPNLILLDKRLPGMDGVEICKYLKTQQATKKIPVILLSAAPNLKSIAKEAGADDFIEKPFDILELKDKIRKNIS